MSTSAITAAGLTLQQERFAQAVIAHDGNASAAIRQVNPDTATWLPESVNVAASRLMANAKVALRIQVLAAEALDAEQVTASWIAGRLKGEATGGDLTEPNHARIRALEVLAKWRGMLVERSESLTLGSVELRVVYDTPPQLAVTVAPQLPEHADS